MEKYVRQYDEVALAMWGTFFSRKYSILLIADDLLNLSFR